MPEEHCGKHEENTTDIAGIKANMRLLMWIFPIVLGISVSVVGYIQKETNSSIEKVANSTQRIENKIEILALTSERTAARLEYHERSERK